MKKERSRIETKLIHTGEPLPRYGGAVVLPIFQTSTYEFEAETDYHDIKYMRLNNSPNHKALHAKLAALENAEAALVAASGMAAISTTLLTVLNSGEHFLAQNSLYGGTFGLINHDLPNYDITHDVIDVSDPSSWGAALKPNTKAIYVETITNPTLRVGDLEAVVAFAKDHGLVSIIDNTFASPVNFRPAEWGFDLSLHSCSKYLNGHSDIVAGAVIGRAELLEHITHRLNRLGGCLDVHACFLLHRGVKTLALRVARQNENAMAVAEFLEGHPAVSKVNYPGLASHPDAQRAAKLLDGFGGMLSFELAGVDNPAAAGKIIARLELPVVAPSLGGLESLVTVPAMTSHRGLTPEERAKAGIAEGLVRLSVGVEAKEDLIEDLRQALEG